MKDPRCARSEASIKQALLTLLRQKDLERISMAEVAKAACVSRSTLYDHYGNPREIFEALVLDFLAKVRTLKTQLRCSEADGLCSPQPFCQAVRHAEDFAPVVHHPAFLEVFLHLSLEDPRSTVREFPYGELGLEDHLSDALYRFQMTGCYTAALSATSDEAWEKMQQAIDSFIRGGINALRS